MKQASAQSFSHWGMFEAVSHARFIIPPRFKVADGELDHLHLEASRPDGIVRIDRDDAKLHIGHTSPPNLTEGYVKQHTADDLVSEGRRLSERGHLVVLLFSHQECMAVELQVPFLRYERLPHIGHTSQPNTT